MALKETDIVGCILTLGGDLTLKPVFACRYCSLLKFSESLDLLGELALVKSLRGACTSLRVGD